MQSSGSHGLAKGSLRSSREEAALNSAMLALHRLWMQCDLIVECIDRRDFEGLKDMLLQCFGLLQKLRECASNLDESPIPIDALNLPPCIGYSTVAQTGDSRS